MAPSPQPNDDERLLRELAQLLTSALGLSANPVQITPDETLFGGRLGLDSVDALQWLCALERERGIILTESELAQGALDSLSAVAQVIRARQGT